MFPKKQFGRPMSRLRESTPLPKLPKTDPAPPVGQPSMWWRATWISVAILSIGITIGVTAHLTAARTAPKTVSIKGLDEVVALQKKLEQYRFSIEDGSQRLTELTRRIEEQLITQEKIKSYLFMLEQRLETGHADLLVDEMPLEPYLEPLQIPKDAKLRGIGTILPTFGCEHAVFGTIEANEILHRGLSLSGILERTLHTLVRKKILTDREAVWIIESNRRLKYVDAETPPEK